MKLSDHVDHIRNLIYKAFDKQFGRLGLQSSGIKEKVDLSESLLAKRAKIEYLVESHKNEKGDYKQAREKALDELTFTLFNRLAAIKVMEAHQMFPPILTRETEHGDRSFGHKMWLEQNPSGRSEDMEGIREYLKHEFNKLGEDIPLYHRNYPYALLPHTIDLNEIIETFNDVAKDPQVDDDIWQSDDVLGWTYESYNAVRKKAHKDSKKKTEYHKVSLQSQVYTPRWVVEFLVNNSLGKLYLEMYPDSAIKDRYRIANAPANRIREPRPLDEIKLIDPATGSGNFLLYAFELFYSLYEDQIDHYGAYYDEEDIPTLIIEKNLHGIDLDDRAIQLAQLGLWIKARKKQRNIGNLQFNIVSSDFFLPDFDLVYPIFEQSTTASRQLEIIEGIWSDLQQAYKFGSLVRLEEKLSSRFHGIMDESNTTLFGEDDLREYDRFRDAFFTNLERAVSSYATQQGSSFLTDKTRDAITYLRLLTQKYDVATANPPYTDSSDFGPELKKFIQANYKKPYKFHTNLYATFIKRCFELTDEHGKIAMIHPHTFMFIKTFEDVRTYMIEKSHVDVLVDYGLDRVNLFGPGILLDATFYVLSKSDLEEKGLYFNLTTNLQEKFKKSKFLEAVQDHCDRRKNERVYELEQSKLKIIKSWPFIYWISDAFREKFAANTTGNVLKLCSGIGTGDNNRFLRFWWEVDPKTISDNHVKDNKKWCFHAKGGPYNKWYGNMWLCIDWENNGKNIKGFPKSTIRNESYYFRKGMSFAKAGSKTPSFRYISNNGIFDSSSPAIFTDKFTNLEYSIALLNSKLASYLLECLNPTAGMQVGDIERTPFVKPNIVIEEKVTELANLNIQIKKRINDYCIIENNFKTSPLLSSGSQDIKQRIISYFIFENHLQTHILINEAIINEKIFEIYELTADDRAMILAKEGESIGGLPISARAKKAYLENEIKEFPLDRVRDYIKELSEREFTTEERGTIEKEFPQLYQSNNDLEEFCIRHQVNPINVWYWFRESNVIPKQRMNELAMEFLADMIREILMEDEDGIIPLVSNAGEKVLLDRIEEKFIEKGFSMAQYSSFDSVLGRELNEYLNHHFFRNFSDHLNLFMYLPKTPFIWHLSSGPERGFDCYIIIYKWSRDKLLSIRSRYIEQRERALKNRQSDLRDKSSPSAAEQNELDTIYKQLNEIEAYKHKIDQLLEEDYDPVLDDGVGKNIAPLQQKKMIPYDVLTDGQLEKYLNADW